MNALAYSTPLGEAYCGDAADLIGQLDDDSVSLVLTSPPFALQRQKDYREISQSEYVDWLCGFGEKIKPKLK